MSDRSTADLKALKSIKHSLKAIIALANRSWALPEKDVFNPNRKTQPETAVCMGARKAPKQKHGPSDENSTEQCIGPVKGKHARKYTDPYAGGERLGKCAKPDVVSAAANECACAAITMHAPVLAPACASPSAAAAGSAACSSTCGNPSAGAPFTFLPSSAAPGLTLAPLSDTSPKHTFAPPSAALAGSAARSSTCGNPPTAVPFAFSPSSATPGHAFAPLSAASLGHAFAPPSSAGPGLGYAGAPPNSVFWAKLKPGNAAACLHSTPGLPSLVFSEYVMLGAPFRF